MIWKRSRNIGKRVSRIRTYVTLVCYFLSLCLSFVLYAYATSTETVEQFIEWKQSNVIVFMICISLLTVSTVYLVLFSQFRARVKLVLYLFTILCLVLIYFWDRGAPQPGNEVFKYGYYASRGVILIYYSSVLFLICIFYPNVLFYRHNKNLARKSWLIFGVVALIVLVVVLFQYSNRVKYFRKGMFGESFNPGLTKCRVDDDTFLVSHYLPRSFFHPIFFTYWCRNNHEFTELIEDNEQKEDQRMSKIKIDLKICNVDEIKISKIPSITKEHYTYEELTSNQKYPYFAQLQYSIRDKKELEFIEITREDRKLGHFIYEFDSEHYETIFVSCGQNLRNYVTAPKRFRVKKRKETLGTVSKDKPNIYVLFFDSASRKDFEMAIPKTTQYIKSISQFAKNDNKHHIIDYYQFFNYKSSGSNTYRNTMAMLLGLTKGNQVPIFELAKSQGYVTVFADSLCNEWSTLYNHFGGLDGDRMYLNDYTHLEPTCDPSYTDLETFYNPLRGSSGSCRRCLFQKEAFQGVLEYGEKIEKLFPNTPKWMYLGSMDAHDATGESLQYIDEHLLKFLMFLERSGSLGKSIILFTSDHGNIIHFIQNMFKEGKIEGRNPVFGAAFPNGFLREDQKKNIEVNQHRLVSHYDVHRTMMDLLQVDKNSEEYLVNEPGICLFDTEVPFNRGCLEAGIPENHICDVVCE